MGLFVDQGAGEISWALTNCPLVLLTLLGPVERLQRQFLSEEARTQMTRASGHLRIQVARCKGCEFSRDDPPRLRWTDHFCGSLRLAAGPAVMQRGTTGVFASRHPPLSMAGDRCHRPQVCRVIVASSMLTRCRARHITHMLCDAVRCSIPVNCACLCGSVESSPPPFATTT